MEYKKARITPYIHAMVYHMPRFTHLHSGIKEFTSKDKKGIIKNLQGVSKRILPLEKVC